MLEGQKFDSRENKSFLLKDEKTNRLIYKDYLLIYTFSSFQFLYL